MRIDLVSPICVALDASDPDEVTRVAEDVRGSVGAVKVGLTAFTSGGPELVRTLAARHRVFLDLKLHDIPAQVAGAISSVGALGVSWTTVHAQGGGEMLRAAAAAAPSHLMVLAVTVLTSLDDAELRKTGLAGPPESAVLRLADLALASGIEGLVCSPLEVAAVRERFGTSSEGGPFLVVPGIRPAGSARGDQRRTLGPREALEAGADLLVVGRPITDAPEPALAARDLLESL
ncbi:MAG: orotidine-5'-phosphate decarboxylase [Actinomycetota bacterium]